MAVRLQWHDDIDAVAADAAGALDRSAQPRLYDRLDWFRMTVAHGLAGPPRVLRARNGDASAWLFLAGAGRRAAPLASWYTLAYAPVLAGNGAGRLLPALFREARRRFDVLALHPVHDTDVVPVRTALREAGWASLPPERVSTHRTATVSTGFAGWWAARPARLRNTVARRGRSHPLSIAIHDGFVAAAWDAYQAVYRASWKPAEGSMPFLRELAMREGAAGALRLGIAHDGGGRAVAAQLWLVESGIATIHKLAHREDAAAGSPGSLLSAAMFAHAIDRDRVTALDFGLGDEPYKADWMEDASPVWRIDAYAPGKARGLAGLGRDALGRLARRIRPR